MWWLSERRRAAASDGLAVITTVAFIIAGSPGTSAGDQAVLALVVYLMCYLILSVAAFSRATHDQIATWAKRESRGTFWQRYLWGTAPGPGASLFIAAGSLVVAVVWLPTDNVIFTYSVRVAIAVLLIAGACASVVVSFAITFYGDHLVDRNRALDFPGRDQPCWTDFVYFAVMLMATFGATDVEVVSAATRRTVTVNTLIAFVFNTVIIATLVSALASL